MTEPDASAPTLRRSLSLFDSTMIVMGTIIGIGIFFQPKRVAEASGSPAMALLAWAFGGVIALSGASTYAALGRILPHTGGPYVYLREGLGRFWAFLYSILALTVIVSGANAAVALVFFDYLGRLVPMAPEARAPVAAGVILFLMVMNILGVRQGSGLQNLFTVLKILALVGVIVVGIGWGSGPDFAARTREAGNPGVGGFAGFIAALVPVLFSIGGWQNLSNVAGEMKKPERDLPRSIFFGVIAVIAIYLLANVSFLRLLPIDRLAHASTPASDALAVAFGENAARVVAVSILCSAFGILNGLMLSGPRLYYALAKDGLLPAPFAAVHPRFRTPIVAIVAQGVISAALCMWNDVGKLTDYVVFADALFFALNALALFRLAMRADVKVAPLRLLGQPWCGLVFLVVMSAATIGILVQFWSNARWGLLIFLAAAAIYPLVERARKQRAT